MADTPHTQSAHDTAPARRRDWSARTRANILDAEKYTRFVAIMKRALPVAAVVLIAAVVAYALQPRQQGGVAMTFQSMGHVDNDLAMIKPKLIGTDSHGNPFVVTADRAVQEGRNSKRARLVNVEADMTVNKTNWLNATAAKGVFDATKKTLALNGGIAVYSDSGYELHTKAAHVDLKKSVVRGRHAVTGQGPMGTMRADRFELDRASKKIRLSGNVHTTIDSYGGIK